MIKKKYLSASFYDAGVLIFRLAFGGMMLLHGIGKLSDVINGVKDFPDPIGIGSTLSLVLAAFAEFACSILLIIGLLTRLALLPLITTMFVVVFIHEAHLEIGDKEPPILFLIAFVGLLISGPGKYSADDRLFNK